MKNNIIPIALAIVFVSLLFAASSCSKQPESSSTADQQATSTQSVASSTKTEAANPAQTTKPSATTPQATTPKPYVAPKKPAVTPGQNRYVSIINGAFVPSVITIKANDTVIWTNQDDIANIIIADDNSFESPSIFKGAAFSHKFTTKGYVNYHNKLHNTLSGQVVIN